MIQLLPCGHCALVLAALTGFSVKMLEKFRNPCIHLHQINKGAASTNIALVGTYVQEFD